MTGPFIGLGFLILSVVLFNGSYVLASSCTFSQCKLVISEDDGSTKTIDLNSYKKLLTYNDQANNRYYDFQPCDAISANDPNNCIGFKGCQRESATYSRPMGLKHNPGCTYLTGSDPYVTFAGAEDGGYKRSVQVTYKCDETSAGLSLVLTGAVPVASDESTYLFSLTGADACPSGGGGGICQEENGGIKCIVASLLALLLLVFLVYIIVGIISQLIYIYQACKSKKDEGEEETKRDEISRRRLPKSSSYKRFP